MCPCCYAVVGKGKIVEQGNHADLVSRPGGAYAALVRLQQRDPTLESNPAKDALEAGDYALTAHSSKQLISQVRLPPTYALSACSSCGWVLPNGICFCAELNPVGSAVLGKHLDGYPSLRLLTRFE